MSNTIIHDRIEIRKHLIPYVFTITLPDEEFELGVRYNGQADMFTVSLSKGGELICEAEPLIYGMPLFADFFESGRMPPCTIIPLDESGIQQEVTWDTLENQVFLMIDNGGDYDVE